MAFCSRIFTCCVLFCYQQEHNIFDPTHIKMQLEHIFWLIEKKKKPLSMKVITENVMVWLCKLIM